MAEDTLFSTFAQRWCTAEAPRKATDEEILFAEIDLGTKFSVAYKTFLREVGSCRTPAILTAITAADADLDDISRFYSSDDVIDRTRSAWSEGLSRALVVFASDCMDNAYCFELHPGTEAPADAAVWFFDRDFAEARLAAESFRAWIAQYMTLGT